MSLLIQDMREFYFTMDKSKYSDAFKRFTTHQTELNCFLWTTELAYGIIRQRRILDQYPRNSMAWAALNDITCQAWFPNHKGQVKYRGTIGHMQNQIDGNLINVLSSVAILFVTYFEVYVQERIPSLYGSDGTGRFNQIPAPAKLISEIQKKYSSFCVDSEIVVRADLIKKIRNLYIHQGNENVPRKIGDANVTKWIETLVKGGYPRDLVEKVANDIVGSAVKMSYNASQSGKHLPEEFFYALFTFTNIRRLAEAMEQNLRKGE